MIKFTDVSFGYNRHQLLFDQLSVELHKGNIYGLLGPNGAGKSSFLKLILGLLIPNNGKITVNNFVPQRRSPTFLEDAFFLPEEFFSPPVSLQSYAKIHEPFYPNFDYDFIQKILFEFDIDIDTRLDRLSFGDRKKAFIAFGLATKTSLLILDEPTNGLDVPSKSLFRKIMASAASSDRIIIISTHQVRDLESLIDPILILNEGEFVLNARSEEITKSLNFKHLNHITETQKAEALFVDSSLRGHSVVLPNHEQDDSRLDLELLFQAAITNPKKIKTISELLNTSYSHEPTY